MSGRPPKSAWMLLNLYVLCGIGVSAGPFRTYAAQLFGRSGYGTFLIVNVMLPITAIGLGAAHRRPGVAAAGGGLLTFGVVIEAMMRLQPNAAAWTFSTLTGALHPILLVAGAGYALIGAGAAWTSGRIQRWAKGSPLTSF